MSYAEKLQRGLRLIACCAWVMMALIFSGHAYAQQDQGLSKTVTVDVPAQKVSTALIELSKQAGVQVIMPGTELDALITQGVHGTMTLAEALSRLLQGTSLIFRETAPDTITVKVSLAAVGRVGDVATLADDTSSTAPDSQSGAGQTDVVRTQDKSASSAQELEQVVVVGSRIPQSAKDSAVPVEVYKRQDIDRTGAGSVTDFLNTLPNMSVQVNERGDVQTFAGGQTVSLRGLPQGTTLVLINGRRVESTGSQGGQFFDLSQIPLAAVDRIEVLPTGSSAIYGGDGLGGVVNIVLKQNYKGFEADVQYGGTEDGKYNETNASFSAGWKADRWSLSLIGQYADNSELEGFERSIAANGDYTQFGGIDGRSNFANPGNVCSTNGKNLPGLNASCAGIPSGSNGVGLTSSDFSATAGVLNKASLESYYSLLSPSRHYGAFVTGTYEIRPSLEVFTELLFNHQQQETWLSPPVAPISVPASNQYNPFGEAVTVDHLFASLGRRCYCGDIDYFRPVVGLRGAIKDKWNWEIAGWTSRDWSDIPETNTTRNTSAINAAIANGSFNPFQDGAGASQSVINSFYSPTLHSYRGVMNSVNGFIRGPIVELDSGSVEGVVGAEYQEDKFNEAIPSVATESNAFGRQEQAAFAEIKIPIIGNHAHPERGDIVSTQLAVRYDHYSDFGGRVSTGAGLEFRPINSLLLRGSFSSAFKPPSLIDAYAPQTSSPGTINDPMRGGQSELVTETYGGNPQLRPETGWSRNIGLVFSPEAIPRLDVSLTNWEIHIKNGFLTPDPQVEVDFPQAFAGSIARAPLTPGDTYPVGPVTTISDTVLNFGYISESGLDFALNWHAKTSWGEFSPSLTVTETYRYIFELDPSIGPQDADSRANDSAQYAPRWKGTLALNWKLNLIQAGVDGRYTGWYKDVNDLSASPRGLGNFWYFDANIRYEVGKQFLPSSSRFSQLFIAGGARNLFNKLPPYSDYEFGTVGWDPNEYNIQGRFLWAQIGLKF